MSRLFRSAAFTEGGESEKDKVLLLAMDGILNVPPVMAASPRFFFTCFLMLPPHLHQSQVIICLSSHFFYPAKINSYSREETSLEIHFLPLFFFFSRPCPRIVTLKSFSPFVSQVNPRDRIIIQALSGIRRTARIVISAAKSNPQEEG